MYKGEVLKGANFALICGLLILSLLLSSSTSTPLYLFVLSVILLMWLIGIMDAYVDEEFITGRERWWIWQRALAILPVAVSLIAIMALVAIWAQDPPNGKERLAGDATLKNPLVADEVDELVPNDASALDEVDDTEVGAEAHDQSISSEFFSVQVGTFREMRNAEKVHKDLLSRGYTVRVERSESSGGVWCRVLVGRFNSRQDAASFMEKLGRREGFSDMVIWHWSPQ